MGNGKRVMMEEMSWLEISEALKSGVNTVILPMGSVEQHGHHLPLLTDAIEAHYLSMKIAQEMGDVLVAPVIRPGYSEHHMHFPGTISLRNETLANVIRDYCTCLIHHGFKNIVMLTCHGGNTPVLNMVASEVALAHLEDGINAFVIDPLSESYYGKDKDEIGHPVGWPEGIHAGKYETSFVLAYRPELVEMDKATTEWPESYKTHEGKFAFNEETMMLALTKGMRYFTKSGVIGDGKAGDAEYGRRVTEILAKNIAHSLRRMIEVTGD
jgi:creatinine amidohydrolase